MSTTPAPLSLHLPPTVPPDDLVSFPSFVSPEEARSLIDLLDGHTSDCHPRSESESQNESESRCSSSLHWQTEGFERKRRVQRFTSNPTSNATSNNNESDLEQHFGPIIDRIMSVVAATSTSTNAQPPQRPTHLLVEERLPSSFGGVDPTNKWSSKTKLKNKEGSNGRDNPMTNWSVTTFESDRMCRCCGNGDGGGGEATNGNASGDACATSCGCYVAQLSLGLPSIQRLNKPQQRHVECWDLVSDDHHATIDMDGNSLLIKRGEVLNEWRSRVDVPFPGSGYGNSSGNAENGNGSDATRSIVLTFRYINERPRSEDFRKDNHHASSFEGNLSEHPAPVATSLDEMPPLRDLLTIVVTTSPIKSNPSTELLEKTFDTFSHAGREFAYQCRKVIICDGCRVLDDDNNDGNNDESVREEKKEGDASGDSQAQQARPNNKKKISRKHSNVKQALRNGIATRSQAEQYEEFKARLRRVCEEANAEGGGSGNSPFLNTEVVELATRHGYGFALRHALRHCVDTPYVCVIQHDRTFMRTTPMKSVVHAMLNNPTQIKYVGCSMRSNLMYRDIFVGKYGKSSHEELGRMVLCPPELRLDSALYGPNVTVESIQVYAPHASNTDKLLKNLRALAANYKKSSQSRGYSDILDRRREEGTSSDDPANHQMTLTPTLFWYDNTHVVETSHYRDFVFNEKYRMVARGGFVEDKLSPVITKSVERLGLKEGHAKFGCYLLDDHSGLFFTGHLDGGAFITTSERGELLSNLMKHPS